MKNLIFIFLFIALFSLGLPSRASSLNVPAAASIQPGAEQINVYLPLLKDKRVGVFVNQSSLVHQTHLVDELLKYNINIVKIFVPEHGLRGTADDGENIDDGVDKKTGIPIVSLYGKKVKPTPDDLHNIDILVFDVQDVGVRFYTFISSLQKFMEAALENDKPLIILDRPNPNGFYVDGPVLDLKFKSFTGMQPVPFVYGMTIGEYAKMLIGEEWLEVIPKSKAKKLKLTVVPCINYTHKSFYELKVRPSPNLPEMQSVYWYASNGLMEATVLSVGRGTDSPFQMFGHPSLPATSTTFKFIPTTREGAKHPLYENQICYGRDLRGSKEATLQKINGKIQIKYLLDAYQLFPDKAHFFEKSFNLAAGNDILIKQIKSGLSETEIRKSWQPKLSQFKNIRKKYLMYPDFE